MSREERRAVRLAQAVVRAREPGWRDLAADLVMVHGCAPPDMAQRAGDRLLRWYPGSRLDFSGRVEKAPESDHAQGA